MTVEKIIESAKDTQERLFALEPGDRRAQGAAGISCAVAIRSHAEKQSFRGFGGALTESSGYVLSFLPEEKREAVLHAYFCPDTAEGNGVGNRSDAPVLVDTKSGDVYFQSSFYAIGHFSRYIEPGAKRLALSCTGFMMPATVDGRMGNTLEACALKNPGGSIVLVISNRTEADAVYQLSLDDASPESFRAPARSIQTLIIR